MNQRSARLSTAIWLGAIIAAIRLPAFWLAVTLMERYADSRQVAGYFLFLVSSLVEVSIVSIFTRSRSINLIASPLLIVMTSMLLGWWLARRRARGSA